MTTDKRQEDYQNRRRTAEDFRRKRRKDDYEAKSRAAQILSTWRVGVLRDHVNKPMAEIISAFERSFACALADVDAILPLGLYKKPELTFDFDQGRIDIHFEDDHPILGELLMQTGLIPRPPPPEDPVVSHMRHLYKDNPTIQINPRGDRGELHYTSEGVFVEALIRVPDDFVEAITRVPDGSGEKSES